MIQSNSAHCAKRGLVRVPNSYIDAASAQVFAPGLFGGFSFRGLKKLKGGQNTVKRNSKRESSKKNLEESESFSVSKFSPATGVSPVCVALFC